jgi:hypothetical protein
MMVRLIIIVVLGLGFALSFIFSQKNLANPQTAKETEECRQERLNPSGHYTVEYDLKALLQNDNNVNIETILGVVANEKDMRFQPYIFMGDKQLNLNEPSISLKCGDRENRSYVFPADNTSSVAVVFQVLPDTSAPNSPIMIPESMEKYNTDSPVPFEREFDFAEDHTSERSMAFREAVRFESKAFEKVNAEIKESIELRDAYVFDWAEPEKGRGTFVKYLTDKTTTYKFGVYFSDVFPPNFEYMKNKTDIYTITCLLNGKQINAFNGLHAWAGYLYQGQAVVLEGKVKITQKGWNQLKCIALDNVYAEMGKESQYSHRITATNIYLE